MATVTLSVSSAPNGSTHFKNNAKIRVTYETSVGGIKITELEGYWSIGSWNYDKKTVYITVNGTKKTCKLGNYIRFSSSYFAWDLYNTEWSGITSGSTSITVTLPDSGSTEHSKAVFKTSSNISITKPSYTIKYDANGGSGAPSSQTKTHGTSLTLSSTRPTRASIQEEDVLVTYTFKGWATSKSSTTASYQPGGSFTKNADTTLYAVWSKTSTVNKYDITYETGTGRVIPGQIKTKGTALTLTSTTPSKNGFTFKHWNTKEDGTGTGYASGASFTTDANTTLWAIYTPWTHTVSYNANGGSGAPSSQTKTGGINLLLSETVPTRDGYTFRYWNTASDGSGTRYNNEDNYTYEKNGGTVTLYAIWASNNISIGASDKKCKSLYFEEDSSLLGFKNTYTVTAGELIEGASSVKIQPGKMYFSEIIEK